MDVNVVNRERSTLPHNISHRAYKSIQMGNTPPSEVMTAAKLLIENCAHMDLVNVHGIEASSSLLYLQNSLSDL